MINEGSQLKRLTTNRQVLSLDHLNTFATKGDNNTGILLILANKGQHKGMQKKVLDLATRT